MDNSAVKTIDRMVEILDYITKSHSPVSLAELSEHLNLPKSTLHRFLVGLDSCGILRRDTKDKKWRLGYHLIVWGSATAESISIREIAHPIMADLVAATGETAIMTVYTAHEIVCVDMVETNHPVRLRLKVGAQQSPHAGASSKVLTAYLPEEVVNAIIEEKGLPRLCTNTITDIEKLKGEFARIRERGYADSVEETDSGAWGVATPIFDWKCEVTAAIGIAGPTMRYSPEKAKQYAELCRQAADKISNQMSAGIPNQFDCHPTTSSKENH